MEKVLGLEIADDKIKIIKLLPAQEAGKVVVLHVATLPLPPQSLKNGAIVSQKLVSEIISSFIKKNNITTDKVIALLNTPHVAARISLLPQNLNETQIKSNLEAEINQYQIFSGKNNILDFKKIEEISDEGVKKVNVLFTATHRELTESYLKTLSMAGLDLVGVDVPILSLIRLLDGVDFSSESLDATLLVLLGEKNIDMCILKGNRPRFMHSIEIDSRNFDKDKTIFINRLVSAIRLVVSFYQERIVHREQITRVIIHPAHAFFSEVPELIKDRISGIPVQLSNPLGKIVIQKDSKESQSKAEDLRFHFAPLVGAAFRVENKDVLYNLDLLHEQKSAMSNRFIQVYLLLTSLTIVLVVMLIIFTVLTFNMQIVDSKIRKILSVAQAPTPELTKALAVKKHIEGLSKQITEADFLKALQKSSYFQNLAQAGVLVPMDLWLRRMSITIAKEEGKSFLDIEGEARSENNIFDYISRLSKSNIFGSVELISSKSGGETVQFSVRCKII
jgi:Tfp pilus assembly PilM family ATPase/Tfp pilus assembly protein PilN